MSGPEMNYQKYHECSDGKFAYRTWSIIIVVAITIFILWKILN